MREGALGFVVFMIGCSPASPEPRSEATPDGSGATPLATASASLARDPCANFRCTAGQHCTAPDDRPTCVADSGPPTRDPCASFSCPTGQHCTAPNDRPVCVADVKASRDPCASMTCAAGQQCTAPDDRARCVPNVP